jgi:YD repeat-containing protein
MEMAWGWMRHAAAGILLLGLSFSANAERYWLDNFADANRTHYATGEEACVTGVLQRILDEYRASSTQPHEITSISIGPDNGIDERVCQGVISRQASGFWVPVEQIDTRVFGPRGTTPVCNLPGLADPDTGQCGVPKCEEGCELAGGNGSNPIDSATGNKSQREVDYVGSGVFPLRFERTYNSHRAADVEARPIGVGWSHTYSAHFNTVYEPGGGLAVRMYRPNGAIQKFSYNGSVWTGDPDITARFAAVVVSGFIESATYTTQDDTVETYNADGRLLTITNRDGLKQILTYATASGTSAYVQRVTDPQGRTLTFTYTDGQVTGLTDSSGVSIAFGYLSGDLVSAAYPAASGTAVRSYLYNEAGQTGGISQPHLLTGIVDENNQRFASWGYDAQRRGTLSVHGPYAGGTADRVSIVYNPNGTSTITDMHGQVRTYGFDVRHRVARIAQLDVPCDHCANVAQAKTYDANGYPDLSTDFRGSVADENYDTRGLRVQVVEASNDSGGNRRTIQTDWHATARVPAERRVYNAAGTLVARSNWTYNGRGQTLTFTQTDLVTAVPRTTTTVYCEQSDVTAGTCPFVGLVKSVNGPRSDVADAVFYAYYVADAPTCASAPSACPYRKGDLRTVLNGLGQVIETLKYDGAGRPLSIKDVNGVITDYEYHPRGWLTASKVRGTNNTIETDDLVTGIEYWPTGLVKKVVQPDGVFTSYTYDAAHRLTEVTGSDGIRVVYTLDNAGNRVEEKSYGASGTLYRQLGRVYDALGRLSTQADAQNNPTDFSYDANGNIDTTTDPLGRIADHDHDPLNRLKLTLQNVGGIAAQTQFEYDALDNLTKVIDPKGLATSYVYNGFGDLTKLTSPDTGITYYAVDRAGNRSVQIDARGITVNYSYDALNRLTGASYADTSYNQSYTYDTTQTACAAGETFGKGRLTRVENGNGALLQYCYDRFGRMVRKVQTVDGQALTLRYAYTKAGELQSVTYPGGLVVSYQRNALGRVSAIVVAPPGGSGQVLLSSVLYYPYGPALSWKYGNGRLLSRPHDRNYWPTAMRDDRAGGLQTGYGYDVAGQVTELRQPANPAVKLARYRYDGLGRLDQTQDGPTGTPIETYGYDATGNRSSLTDSVGTQAYGYPANSHRLTSVAGVARGYDGAGNLATIGGTAREYFYSPTGRMRATRSGGITTYYAYNGHGEQVRRFHAAPGSPGQEYFLYDEAGR